MFAERGYAAANRPVHSPPLQHLQDSPRTLVYEGPAPIRSPSGRRSPRSLLPSSFLVPSFKGDCRVRMAWSDQLQVDITLLGDDGVKHLREHPPDLRKRNAPPSCSPGSERHEGSMCTAGWRPLPTSGHSISDV